MYLLDLARAAEYKTSKTTLTSTWKHDGSRWKNRYVCQNCYYKLFDEPTKYCPNCGLRMGVETNGN